MRAVVVVTFLMFSFFSCKNKTQNSLTQIVIEGNIKGVPDGKIYFVESRKWKSPLDSTTITNGTFVFKTKLHASPFLAAIHYWDGTNVIRLKYRNHTLGDDSMQYATDAFYAEGGTVTITGSNNTAPYLRIFAGKENELLFKNQFIDFGWIGNADTLTRIEKINSFTKTIKENSYSYFLLESIFRSKEQYSKSELTTLFGLFNPIVQQSQEGIDFKKYLSIRPDDNKPLPNLLLLTPENNSHNIIDTTAKINMLVFWASWCMPCRKEVPLLKEIKAEYAGTGLNMVSISIDEKKESWLKAVAFEKMNWLQVHVPFEKIEAVQNQFSFVTIPLIIFTDRRGIEIKRFADYDPDNVAAYKSLINSYIQ